MSGRDRLAEYLQDNDVEFNTQKHEEAYTAQEVAAAEHVPGERFVKTVMVKADGRLVMLCLPAPYEVDLDAAARTLGANSVSLAEEKDFESIFADCEVGAMPPFGNLYDVPVVVDEALTTNDRIVFNAASHSETFEVAYDDFERLVEPRVGNFGHHQD